MYSLNPLDVKKVIDAKSNNEPFDQEHFMFYHLNRNHFNVQDEITTLHHVQGSIYRDNLDCLWEEQSTLKNFFHMPKGNWASSMVGLSTPYSRKFLRDDDDSEIGGEFEMIIRRDGKRIDALTHEQYQETYNFGRTQNSALHLLLDIKPHKQNPNYAFKKNMGQVKIFEEQ